MRPIYTIRRYQLMEVASALQKAIRRADARLAGYWAMELLESGFHQYLWKRLLTVSAEDCWGILTQEVVALRDAHLAVAKDRQKVTRIFIAKAVLLLCQAKKNRDADHLTNLVYDARGIPDAQLEADLAAARANPEEIPEYAFDVHTEAGKRAGKTKAQFFKTEHQALQPFIPGLFDGEVDKLNTEGTR